MKLSGTIQKTRVYGIRLQVAALVGLSFLASCATTPQLPPPPPQHVYKEEKTAAPSVNSLWSDTSGLFDDHKARRLNDLVTIRVVENITGSGTASTNTSRESSADYNVDEFFGMNKDFNIQNVWGLKDFYKGANVFNPAVKGSGKSDFAGKGDTVREGKLIGTITARVVEVMPNGNLLLESRKEITINNEKQILVFHGMIRPEDVTIDNTVMSSSVADAPDILCGARVATGKTEPGLAGKVYGPGMAILIAADDGQIYGQRAHSIHIFFQIVEDRACLPAGNEREYYVFS